jgi:hypothetical protein
VAFPGKNTARWSMILLDTDRDRLIFNQSSTKATTPKRVEMSEEGEERKHSSIHIVCCEALRKHFLLVL